LKAARANSEIRNESGPGHDGAARDQDRAPQQWPGVEKRCRGTGVEEVPVFGRTQKDVGGGSGSGRRSRPKAEKPICARPVVRPTKASLPNDEKEAIRPRRQRTAQKSKRATPSTRPARQSSNGLPTWGPSDSFSSWVFGFLLNTETPTGHRPHAVDHRAAIVQLRRVPVQDFVNVRGPDGSSSAGGRVDVHPTEAGG